MEKLNIPLVEEENFRNIYVDLSRDGKISHPRDMKVIELEDYSYDLSPYSRFANFHDRKLNINYIKNEFKWYLKGDRFDTSITDHASMWKDLIDNDGGINSNYGQYIFGEEMGFIRAANQLIEDKDSRRASIAIFSNDKAGSSDTPCTYALNFRIRDDKLNMSVHMRSQDGIYGLGNDAPAFSFIHEMMYNYLSNDYTNLAYGNYHHSVDSFHVYEKHFSMLEKIAGISLKETVVHNNPSRFHKIDCPRINGRDEVEFLLNADFNEIPNDFKFSKWLNEK